jgi:hypothetical protein
MKNKRFIINAILLLTFSISLSAGVRAQSSEILVAGNPAFTASDFEAFVKFYERGLDIRFSDDDRAEFQSRLTATWRRYQKSKGKQLADFLAMVVRMNNGISDEKIKANQQEFIDGLLADLKDMAGNGWSPFVVGVYEKQHGDASTNVAQTNEEPAERSEMTARTETTDNRREPNFQPVQGGIKMSELIGKWGKGTVASYGYRNTVTNDYRSGYGAANQHDLYAGGAFDYTNYAQVSGYGCTTELYTSMKGKASLAGSQITFSYVSGTVRIEDSCKKSSVTRPAQIKNTTYRIERDGERLRMCEVGAENPTCIYKEN